MSSRPWPKNDRKAAWDLAENIYKAQEFGQKLVESKVCRRPITSKRPEDREFVVDSGASMHMMSKKELSSEEVMDSKKVQNPNRSVDCKLPGNTDRSTHVSEPPRYWSLIQRGCPSLSDLNGLAALLCWISSVCGLRTGVTLLSVTDPVDTLQDTLLGKSRRFEDEN